MSSPSAEPNDFEPAAGAGTLDHGSTNTPTLGKIHPSQTEVSTPADACTPPWITFAFSNPPIYESILHNLAAPSLIRLGRCSRLIRQATVDHLRVAMDVNRILSRFFSDPIGFRSIQAQTATLISGSTALQFFEGSSYPDSDLDLYVHIKRAEEVAKWLAEAEGYTFQPSIAQSSDFVEEIKRRRLFGDWHTMEVLSEETPEAQRDASTFHQAQYTIYGVTCVLTFTKTGRDANGSPRKVQVIIARQTPMECILHFHSTYTMNIIAWNEAYCLFPATTLEHRRGLLCRRPYQYQDPHHPEEDPGDMSTRAAFEKYRHRGLTHETDLDSNGWSFYTPHVLRRVNDTHSWTVQLDCNGVDVSTMRHLWDPVVASTFRLEPWKEEVIALIRFRVTITGQLKYQHAVGDTRFMDIFSRLCDKLQWEYDKPLEDGSGQYERSTHRIYRDYEFMQMQEAYLRGAERSELQKIFFAGVVVPKDIR